MIPTDPPVDPIHVLLVDDDDIDVMNVRRAFEKGNISNPLYIARDGVEGVRHAEEVGGLSGAPLMAKSTAVLRMLRTRLPESIPLIGVGGILHGADAATKQAAGANLVQVYTAFVYQGPGLVRKINEELLELMERDGVREVGEVVGADR